MRALVTGATGAVGGKLAYALSERGHDVRCMVRDRSKASALSDAGFELHEGDVLKPETLRGAGKDVDIAYYLIHSMGRGGDGDFATRERGAAKAFAAMTREDGVGRVAYLGGLGDDPQSQHLKSRQETAEILADEGPPLTYFRASMLIGASSESYKTLRYLVERLPAMIAPAWLKTRTQPIAMGDAVEYLAQAADRPEAEGREVQIACDEVVTYGDLLDHMARALDRRPRPKLPVPFISPRLSSLWIGLVTPVDAGVARPLVEGLSTPTVVTDPSGARLFDVDPMSIDRALRRAVEDDLGDAAPPSAVPA